MVLAIYLTELDRANDIVNMLFLKVCLLIMLLLYVIESKKHTPSIVEISVKRYVTETKTLVRPLLNYTQGSFSKGNSSRGSFCGSSRGGGPSI